jgi:hypothetical protein
VEVTCKRFCHTIQFTYPIVQHNASPAAACHSSAEAGEGTATTAGHWMLSPHPPRARAPTPGTESIQYTKTYQLRTSDHLDMRPHVLAAAWAAMRASGALPSASPG